MHTPADGERKRRGTDLSFLFHLIPLPDTEVLLVRKAWDRLVRLSTCSLTVGICHHHIFVWWASSYCPGLLRLLSLSQLREGEFTLSPPPR